MTLRLLASVPEKPFEHVDTNSSWFQTHSRVCGEEFKSVALAYLRTAGPAAVDDISRVDIYPVDGALATRHGERILWMANGCFDDGRHAGLRRTSTVEKLLSRCYALHAIDAPPMLVVTSHLPNEQSQSARLLARASDALGTWLVDVVATTGDLAGFQRLQNILTGTPAGNPVGDAPRRHDPKPSTRDLFSFGYHEEVY